MWWIEGTLWSTKDQHNNHQTWFAGFGQSKWKHHGSCCVHHFCYPDNPISTPQVTILADMLKANTTLTELYLGSENTISSGFINAPVHMSSFFIYALIVIVGETPELTKVVLAFWGQHGVHVVAIFICSEISSFGKRVFISPQTFHGIGINADSTSLNHGTLQPHFCSEKELKITNTVVSVFAQQEDRVWEKWRSKHNRHLVEGTLFYIPFWRSKGA